MHPLVDIQHALSAYWGMQITSSTYSMYYGNADKLICMPNKKESAKCGILRNKHCLALLHKITPLSKPQIANMIGCWKAPKSDVIREEKQSNFYWLFQIITSSNHSLSNFIQLRISAMLPSALASGNLPLSFEVTNSARHMFASLSALPNVPALLSTVFHLKNFKQNKFN